MIDDEIKDLVNKMCIKYKLFYTLDRVELLKMIMSFKHNYNPDKAPVKNYFIEVTKQCMSKMYHKNLERTKVIEKRKIKINKIYELLHFNR